MFKTFPDFSKLTLDDKEEYEALVKDFPPIADLTFSSLMTWWNAADNISVSELNGNLVIPYWLPGDEKHAGLSLVGINKVDESICTLFDYLRDKGEVPQLVNVPERVVSNVQYPELFNFHEERSRYDYVLAVAKFYPIENIQGHRRRKVEKQLQIRSAASIDVRALNLRKEDDQQLLLDTADQWWNKNLNNLGRVEKEAMIYSVVNAERLGIENVCLFINGKLHGFCIYQQSTDKSYAVVSHIKATNKTLLGFELIAHLFGEWFSNQGIEFVNINSDEGQVRLRMFMLTLGPVNFFRKYRIEPA